MSPERWNKIKQLFQSAIELDGPARGAVVTEARLNDPEIASIVESMIAAHESDPSFLEQPLVCTAEQLEGALRPPRQTNANRDASQSTTPLSTAFPDRIGNYRICGLLGEGGMGIVYDAEQDNPRRRVALKVIKPGVASRKMIQRFDFEAQLLGRLHHPGIAQIHEAGTEEIDSHRLPYFAMELVDGVPLTAFADSQKLGTRGRLQLMLTICDAVQHAHSNGVIHRDLKPANILVPHSGQPKVLDFGIARAVDSDIRATTLKTDIGQLIGTIPYMSPEQVAGNPTLVDARSDVYSLGVVAYELLTGRLPYDLDGHSIPDAVRIIGEARPHPPSSTNKRFLGDVDTILGKALEKDPARRYQTASDLGGDIYRYLNNEPIMARPPSTFYQFKKLVSRHKVPSALLAVLFVASCGFGVAMSIMYLRAAAAQQRATTQAAMSDTVSGFLESILSSLDPEVAEGRDTTILRELLDAAARRAATELHDQPEVEARIRYTIAKVYESLTMPDETIKHARAAVSLYQRLFGEMNEGVAKSLCAEAGGLICKSDFQAAEQVAERSLKICRETLGSQNPQTAKALRVLALAKNRQGHFADAAPLYQQSLSITLNAFGERHPDTAETLLSLAELYREWGGAEASKRTMRFNKALDFGQRALQIYKAIYGQEHARVALATNEVGVMQYYLGHYDTAETMLRQAVAMCRTIFGENHQTTSAARNNLADCLSLSGKYDEAVPLFEHQRVERRLRFGEDSLEYAFTCINLGGAYQGQGELEKSIEANRAGLKALRRVAEDHPYIANVSAKLARQLEAHGDYGEALEVWRDVQSRRMEASPEGKPDHWQVGDADCGMGRCLTALGRYVEAEPLLLEGRKTLEAKFGPRHERVLKSLESLLDLYTKWGKIDKAAEIRGQLSPNRATEP